MRQVHVFLTLSQRHNLVDLLRQNPMQRVFGDGDEIGQRLALAGLLLPTDDAPVFSIARSEQVRRAETPCCWEDSITVRISSLVCSLSGYLCAPFHGQQIDCDEGKISTVERGLLDELHSSRQHPGQTADQCEHPLAAIPHPLSQTRAHPRNALLRSSSFRSHPLISSELQANPASSLSGGHLLKVLFLVRKGVLT